ncbi:MAG: aminotransferase IV [Phycisphaerae bacterium]|jgi:branched-chain amino acid aminotransferase|nr:aminotransferase IV [Phycisphaerae bacterium]
MLQTFDKRNKDLQININGELFHRDVAGISPFDSVVQGGDGVWEGLRLYNGRIFKLEEHLNRLRHSAQAMAFENIPNNEEMISEIAKTIQANNMNDGVHIRLTLTRGKKITSGMDPRLNQDGNTLIVLAEFKSPVYDTSGLSLATSSIRRFTPDTLDPKIHSCNLIQSIMAKIEANAAGVDDALMLDSRGFIAETNATHLFFVKDEVVLTSKAIACPEGVTRQVVIDLCNEHSIDLIVKDCSQAELYRADECFCTGTMGELASITKVDGRIIGSGSIGPMTSRLTDLFKSLVAKSGTLINC